MSFSIRHFQQDGLSLVGLKDDASGSEVLILPGFGAALHAFLVHVPGDGRAAGPRDGGAGDAGAGAGGSQDGGAGDAGDAGNASDAGDTGEASDANDAGADAGELFNVIDNYGDLEQVQREMGVNFKGPKLSPFPCRMANATYRFAGHEYTFDRLFGDGSAIHGLLYDKAFAVTDEAAGKTSASVIMQHRYAREASAYPYVYDCAVKYILHPGNLLEIQTTVTNLDKTTIPIADGWHPYFRLGGRIDSWMFRFNSETIVEFDARLIPTGHLLKYDEFRKERPIGSTQLDNCFVLGMEKGNAACELYNPATGLYISLLPDSSYPYLQIFTPPGRESIAIENLSAAPDCFNNKMGLILLPPGHSQTFTVIYKVGFR